VADLEFEALVELNACVGLDALQLHGAEPASLVGRLPNAFKVVHVADQRDIDRARGYPGERLLLDAKVQGELGGTGTSFDWSLVRGLSKERKIVLAGGLTPENVAAAIEVVRPWGVDVASGTEAPTDPRRKDPEAVRRFVLAAKAAVTRS
jgi:phosphoribosylanthranilate isomerase